MAGTEMNKEAFTLDMDELDGGRQAASGVTSVTSRTTIIGVDEDVEDADATMRDELIILAHDDPIWREELRR
ncbi:hypothetical protein AX14_009962 [Amanita brunnescens Koide BX004]|nr:hypothetical protein AX14_009962 [Amanita brunnescens Koide BX004]